MKKLINIFIGLAVFILLLAMSAYANAGTVYTDPAKAFEQSKTEKKPVILVFEGSDWCIPCIRFEKRVLSDPAFIEYCESKFIILKADFPQKKKIPQALETQYEALAEKYNKEGYFPKMVLLGVNGSSAETLRTNYASAADLIKDLQQNEGK